MRVSFVSYDFGEYCVRLASALAQEARVQLLIPESLAGPHRHRLPPSVEFLPFKKPRYRQVPEQLRTAYSLVRQIREFDPDVVHLQQGHPWFNLAVPFLGGYPLVITVHDPRHHTGDSGSRKTPQGVYDFGFRRASQLIAHGKEMCRVLVEQVRFPEERIHVIPHIVLGDESDVPGILEESNTVLFFGRIWGYKGLDYLIRAEPLIRTEIPEARIIIAGTGEDFSRYRAMMADPSRFEVHNEFVSDRRRAELFARAAVVVLPYVEATQSGVIPVAYSFSKPVVATTVGSLPEMVDHGITGLLVPPRSEESLAEAIVRLLQDDELRRKMGEAGKKKIETEASAEAVASSTLEVYRLATSGEGATRRAA